MSRQRGKKTSPTNRATSPTTSQAKPRMRDPTRFKGHGNLRGTKGILSDDEELQVDAEQLAHYLYFLHERNRISLQRFAGEARPWTKDDILNSYRFTDVFRPYDRTTQYINTHVIGEGDQSLEECSFRSMLFRTFGRISTWEYLCEILGTPTWKTFNRARYVQVLDHRLASHKSIYLSAYQTPAPTTDQIGGHSSHEQHLRQIELMMKTSLPQRLQELRELCDQYHFVRLYPGMGPFLAFQYAPVLLLCIVHDSPSTDNAGLF